MKRFVIGLSIALVLAVAGAAVYLLTKEPAQRPPSRAHIVVTDDLVARGEYLARHVTLCLDCHSERYTDRYGYPPVPGQMGAGDPSCAAAAGPDTDFRVCAANITPDAETGLGLWSDGEILRAVREGVDRDGEALFPMMPYTHLRHLSDEDARAIVAFLRSLSPVPRPTTERLLPFPMSVLVKFRPAPLEGPVPSPPAGDSVARGRYLARVAGCAFCHTPVDSQSNPVESQAFSGGQSFPLPDGSSIVSTNLTPHETGLGETSREAFIARFEAFADPELRRMPVEPAANTVMPWQSYAGMTGEDLGAIHDYLTSLSPIARATPGRPPGDVAERIEAAVNQRSPDAGAVDAGGETPGTERKPQEAP